MATVPTAPGAINVPAASLTYLEFVEIITAGPQKAVATLAAIVGGFGSAKYTTAALQSATIPAANVSGAGSVYFDNTGTTPANLQFPAAADLIATLPVGLQVVGFAYELNIRNDSGSANTATITTNTGITLTGTMTIAQNTTRTFVVTVTGVGAAAAVTVQSVGISAAGA